MEQKTYVYTLKQSSQFKKDLKAVKFDEHKLDELFHLPSSNLFHHPSDIIHLPSAINLLSSIIPRQFVEE